MSEQVQEIVQEQPKVETQSNPFSSQGWVETPVQEEKKVVVVQNPEPPKSVEARVEEEIIDPKEWLKREFDVDDPQIIKQEREELKKLRESAATPSEIKFANEQSERFFNLLKEGKDDDVYNYLHEQKTLSRFTKEDISKLSAEEIVKYSIQQKNKDLTAEDVNFLFNKRFSVPSKPDQALDETDAAYEEKVKNWESAVNAIERELIIEAKMAKPELEKLKSQLVLPELKKPEQPVSQPSQESLDALKKVRDSFIESLESDYSKAEGFKTKVKDESVELPVAFNIPQEEKIAIKESLKDFDVNDYIDKRWFDEKGKPRIEQMMYDRYILDNLDKVLSGVANNAANQRLAHHLKSQSNIHLNSQQSQQTFQPQQQNGQSASPYKQNSWSDKPLIAQN